MEENSRMGKTRDLLKKKEIFMQRWALIIKDRNSMDLRETEDIKKR